MGDNCESLSLHSSIPRSTEFLPSCKLPHLAFLKTEILLIDFSSDLTPSGRSRVGDARWVPRRHAATSLLEKMLVPTVEYVTLLYFTMSTRGTCVVIVNKTLSKRPPARKEFRSHLSTFRLNTRSSVRGWRILLHRGTKNIIRCSIG